MTDLQFALVVASLTLGLGCLIVMPLAVHWLVVLEHRRRRALVDAQIDEIDAQVRAACKAYQKGRVS